MGSTNSTSYEAAINSKIFENDVNDANDENNNNENEMMTKDTAPIIIINSGSPQRRREKENIKSIDSVSVNEININLKKSENCINSSENSTQITTNTVQSNEKDSVNINTNKNSQIQNVEQQHSQNSQNQKNNNNKEN